MCRRCRSALGLPSGLNATAVTPSSWSRREISAPVAASNTRALPLPDMSPLPVATRVAIRAERHRGHAVSWSRRDISAPVAASNTRALRSPLPVATRGLRAERHRGHLAIVVQAGDLGAGRRVEHPRAAIAAAGGHPGRRRAERHRVHRASHALGGRSRRRSPGRTPARCHRRCRSSSPGSRRR